MHMHGKAKLRFDDSFPNPQNTGAGGDAVSSTSRYRPESARLVLLEQWDISAWGEHSGTDAWGPKSKIKACFWSASPSGSPSLRPVRKYSKGRYFFFIAEIVFYRHGYIIWN
jgi:hypothetical protein